MQTTSVKQHADTERSVNWIDSSVAIITEAAYAGMLVDGWLKIVYRCQ